MVHKELSTESAFLIDFNVHWVPAALGLDVPPAAAAAMIGITEDEFQDYAAGVESSVREAAESMLSDPAIAAAIDGLAVPAGGTMMTVGDSITTYRHGYARLLEAMVKLRRPTDEIVFANVAQSGYHTAHGLENVYTQFLAREPDWVSIMFGVNDSKLFGDLPARTLISLEEYHANVTAIGEAFLRHSQARPVLLTPTPVLEDVVNENPDFGLMRMTWRNDDIRARAEAVSDVAQRHGLPLIDLMGLFGETPDPALILPDGLHPSPAGHALILRAVLDGVTAK